MYTYLNQKYGLKTLIIEWASQIISAVKIYLHDDHQVTLFAKILKNECDEDFRHIQMYGAKNLETQLKQVLRERYQLKPEKEICKMQQNIIDSYVEEWVWRRIAHKMFEFNDANYLCQQLMIKVHSKSIGKENKLTKFMHAKQQNKQRLQSLSVKKVNNKRMTRDQEAAIKKQQISQSTKLLY